MRIRRALLQGEGADATLPSLFGQDSCSSYGSHPTDWLRSAPRWTIGLSRFGDYAEPGEFWPWSSTYLEPIIALALVGAVLWIALGLTAIIFFVARYYYGLAGEPFPTTKAYPRREVARVMTATVVCFLLLGALGGFAQLVTSAAANGGYDAALVSAVGIEAVLHDAFAVGREVIAGALVELGSIDAYEVTLSSRYDAVALARYVARTRMRRIAACRRM